MHCLVRAALRFTPVLSVALGSGCGKSPPPETPVNRSVSSPAAAGSAESRRAELLNRIRAADPQKQTIEQALINERNELGLILNRRAPLDQIPKLLQTMLAQLDETFPGQDHTVVAYTPTEPPQVIGTARLDARTRDMTYTPASP